MKQSFLLLATVLLSSLLAAQKMNTWKGGMPGQENNWHCAKNWSNGHVPTVFECVVIPDVSTGSGHYPVISSEAGEIYALRILSGANLLIRPKGRLSLSDPSELPDALLNLGELNGKGVLYFRYNNSPAANMADAGILLQP